jgi:hypothetical protein
MSGAVLGDGGDAAADVVPAPGELFGLQPTGGVLAVRRTAAQAAPT